MDINYDVRTFISKYLYFKIKTRKKFKELEIMYQNAIYICVS